MTPFHALWGKAVGTKDYDKQEWGKLQYAIEQLERDRYALLAVCKAMVSALDDNSKDCEHPDDCETCEFLKPAKEAIAKAEGLTVR